MNAAPIITVHEGLSVILKYNNTSVRVCGIRSYISPKTGESHSSIIRIMPLKANLSKDPKAKTETITARYLKRGLADTARDSSVVAVEIEGNPTVIQTTPSLIPLNSIAYKVFRVLDNGDEVSAFEGYHLDGDPPHPNRRIHYTTRAVITDPKPDSSCAGLTIMIDKKQANLFFDACGHAGHFTLREVKPRSPVRDAKQFYSSAFTDSIYVGKLLRRK